MNRHILVTGAAGFIGAFLCKRLLAEGIYDKVIGIDSLNDYYDPALKFSRLQQLQDPRFVFVQGDIADAQCVGKIMEEYRPEVIVNLAAQAGIRYSAEHPEVYVHANIIGFFTILEAARKYAVRHLVYASSSSVYGMRNDPPFSVKDRTDHPKSFYAATKAADELMAYAYSQTYGIPMTGCRFFTVYGPMGRPDMAYFKFSEILRRGGTISLYNYGKCQRDFTYIDDIIDAVMRIIASPPAGDESGVPHVLYNVGGGRPVGLEDFTQILCEKLKKYGILSEDLVLEDHIERVPMQKGDVELTCADTRDLEENFGIVPAVMIGEGLDRFAFWYASYVRNSSIV